MNKAGTHQMSLVADTFVGTEERTRTFAAAPGVANVAISTISSEAWDALVSGFDEVCQEQLHVFAANRWPSVRQEPVVFTLNGEVVGGSLIMIQRLPLGIGSIAIAKWAPMLARTDRSDFRAIYRGMIEALIEEYAVRRRMMISVLPRAPLGAMNHEYEYLIDRGFKRGATLLFPSRYIVRLGLSDEDQRKSLHQKWRYHLNKADKAGLTFEHAGPERLPEFDALYRSMSDRKKFPDHSAYEETVVPLMALETEAVRPELFFVRHGDEIVAGAIIFKAGDRAVYLYGATNDRALPLRAGYYMHWHIIRWLRDNTRASWYDLGGTDGFQGLHQFKKGMVGDAGVITPVPPVANYAAYRLPYLLGTAAFTARDFVQQVRRVIDLWRSDRAKPDQTRQPHQEPR
jgi:hypothetical protein